MRLIGARQAWHDAFYESGAQCWRWRPTRPPLGKGGVANETHPTAKGHQRA